MPSPLALLPTPQGEHEFGLSHAGAQCDGGAEAETRVDTLESIETLHECRQLCAAEPECRFLSYSPGGGDGLGGRCLLHSACWRDRIIVEANFSVSWMAGHSASPADAAFSREGAARLWEEPHALLSQQPARVAAGPASSLPPFGMAGVAAGATAALAGLIFLASAARVRMSALGSRGFSHSSIRTCTGLAIEGESSERGEYRVPKPHLA